MNPINAKLIISAEIILFSLWETGIIERYFAHSIDYELICQVITYRS